MAHYIYIIYSKTTDKFYIGETENISQRLKWHNTKEFANSSTKIASDWVLKKYFEVNDRTEARTVEKYIKNMKSRKFIESLIKDEVFSLNFRQRVTQKFNIAI
jgi:putative endonuclease